MARIPVPIYVTTMNQFFEFCEQNFINVYVQAEENLYRIKWNHLQGVEDMISALTGTCTEDDKMEFSPEEIPECDYFLSTDLKLYERHIRDGIEEKIRIDEKGKIRGDIREIIQIGDNGIIIKYSGDDSFFKDLREKMRL